MFPSFGPVKFSIQALGHLIPASGRFFWGIERSERNRFPVDSDIGAETPAARDLDALEAACAISPKSPIRNIASAVGEAQIGESVIDAVEIDMVYFIRRPLAGYVQPRKAVTVIRLPVEPDRDVAVSRFMAGNLSVRMDAAHLAAPSEVPRLGIVSQKLFEPLMRYHVSQCINGCDT
jgi:hypothetical protein